MKRRSFIIGGIAATGAALLAGHSIYRGFGSLPDETFVSLQWSDGEFHNLPNSYVNTHLENERKYSGGWIRFLLERGGDRYPPGPVPAVRVDLKSLQDGEFVWLGHSSILLKLSGKVICIDPILSSHASPLPGVISAWQGATPYTASDFPAIDILCISHDHWDHLDLPTLEELQYRSVICGLGVGSHLRYWGLEPLPAELDWFKSCKEGAIRVTFTPSMHFSGRGMTRNKTLWGGFIIDAGSGGKVYFSGDGGYGYHFRDLGKNLGPFDIFFPDAGQYNRAWPTVHMFPEQAAMAGADSRAAVTCPVHTGKFTLSIHPWDEPRKRFERHAERMGLNYMLPVLGEKGKITANS